MWSSISGFVGHAVSKGHTSFIFRVEQYKTTEKKAPWPLKRVGNYKPSDTASSPRNEHWVSTIASVIMLVCWDLYFYWWVKRPATFWEIYISRTEWLKQTQSCKCMRFKQSVQTWPRHSPTTVGITPLLNSECQLLQFCSLFPLWKEVLTLQRLLQQLCLKFYAKNEAQALLYHVVLWQWCNKWSMIFNYFQCSSKSAILWRSSNCRGRHSVFFFFL